jgi:hypothetical protein
MNELEPNDSTGDGQRLDAAVQWLNRATLASGVELSVQVSGYIIDTFFGGDFAAFTSKDPHKTATFVALCQREDLTLGASTLYRLVRIGQQVNALPRDIADSLTMRHHRALLSVDNGQHRQHLARQAVAHGWTAQALQARISAERPADGKKLGRPAQAPAVRWAHALGKATQAAAATDEFAASFAALSPAVQDGVRQAVATARARLDEMLLAMG